jgi:hypothetical protein
MAVGHYREIHAMGARISGWLGAVRSRLKGLDTHGKVRRACARLIIVSLS